MEKQSESMSYPDPTLSSDLARQAGLSPRVVTILGDVVGMKKEYEGNWYGSTGRQLLVIFEWDSCKREYKAPYTLMEAHSSSQYDHSSGDDSYYHSEITQLHLDSQTHILSWIKESTREEENEWTSYHKVMERHVWKHEYDTRTQLCPTCKSLIGNKFFEMLVSGF